MRAGDLLRRLDSRLLPPLAAALARLAHGRVRMRVLTATALLSVSAVLLTAVWTAGRGEPPGDVTVGDVVRVGVTDGESIPQYVRSSRSELATLAADQETYALVTLSAYLAPERLKPILGGISVSQVFGRVPLPGAQTQIVRIPALRVPDDVTAGMVIVADRKNAEATEYREMSSKLTGDSARERELRQVYDSGAEVAIAEAEAYRGGCSCVYAAVVRATPPALDRVFERPEVRAVDAAPEVRRLDRAVFLPPLPEQRDVVRPPVHTALPSGPPAPETPTPPAESPSASAPSPEPSTEPSPSVEPSSATPEPSPSDVPTTAPASE
ncbi:hypothetical protein [Phytohabitans aurantiacus]|uniref:SAF domain-containing protein n=1 Tax=Phytohabitans aurantiacus TaxID=3016789 RepID=A0ABQ5R484_9ACTN|nr:hypothetical protein [Phytohabitans aurantiacus]GLI01153.1 hypothetical protein Pa4123_64290 [Phytohabitans aurantiacus]